MSCKLYAKSHKKTTKVTKKLNKKTKSRNKYLQSPANRAKRPIKATKKRLIKPMSPQDLKTLQKIWYNKLKDTGFNDLETADYNGNLDGLLNNKGSQALSRIAKAFNREQETYFRRLTNFVTHNPNWAGNKTHNLISRLYINGVSYRKMLPQLGVKLSVWSVHKVIKRLKSLAVTWNKVNPEGLDFESDFSDEQALVSY